MALAPKVKDAADIPTEVFRGGGGGGLFNAEFCTTMHRISQYVTKL